MHRHDSQRKYECKDQESIQSSTTPDPGYQWESDKLTARRHKREPRGEGVCYKGGLDLAILFTPFAPNSSALEHLCRSTLAYSIFRAGVGRTVTCPVPCPVPKKDGGKLPFFSVSHIWKKVYLQRRLKTHVVCYSYFCHLIVWYFHHSNIHFE